MTTFTPESRAILKTSMGDITFAFLDGKAPRTCENFVKLARKGFYDGLTFHRIMKGFMIQGGCPRADGSGGPGYTINAEFNDTPHVRGTVSMARGSDPHSAGSQFFICQGDARYLDSKYAAFAKVVAGEDVLDRIASVPVTENRFKEVSQPRDPVFINSIVLEGIEFDAGDAPAERKPARDEDADADADADAADADADADGRAADGEAADDEAGPDETGDAGEDAKPPRGRGRRRRTKD